MPATTEPRHPIGVVAERTGLTPDVLRVWERRYQVVEPRRSPGGQRIYSDADIDRLLLLHRATRGGHGISHVAGLSRSRLEDLVRDVESSGQHLPPRLIPSAELTSIVADAIALAESLDPAGLESLLRRNVARYGIVTFIDTVAAPFLREVGDAWHAGRLSISQEHLATAVVERVVGDAAPLLTGSDGSPVIVIGTLEGERHAGGALMAAATAASEGWRVIYLGADVPAKGIIETAGKTQARAVGISVVFPDRKSKVSAQIREIQEGLPSETTLLVGGAGAGELRQALRKSGIEFVETMSELHEKLSRMRL